MSLQRLEPGVCFDEHVSLPKLRRLWLDPASPGAAVGAPPHVVREPLDVCISAYLCVARPGSTARLPSLMSPIPAAATTCTRAKRGRQPRKDLKGVSIQQALRTSDTRTGYSLSVAARSAIRSHSKRKRSAHASPCARSHYGWRQPRLISMGRCARLHVPSRRRAPARAQRRRRQRRGRQRTGLHSSAPLPSST